MSWINLSNEKLIAKIEKSLDDAELYLKNLKTLDPENPDNSELIKRIPILEVNIGLMREYLDSFRELRGEN